MYALIVARGYPTEKYKMNGIFEFDQAKALVKAGCKIVYASVDVRSIRRWRKWGIQKEHIEGVEVYAINIPGGRIPQRVLQRISILGLKILYKKILEEQGEPDVIHAHFASIGYTAAKLKRKTNIPLVVTEHLSSMLDPTIDKRLFQIASYAYQNADALITVSNELKTVIKERFNKEAIYIPNMVDTKLFTYSPNEDDGIFRFVSVGGLIYRKRMDLTIEAFIRAFKNNRDVRLTIFGDGYERVKLEKLIQKSNFQDRVKLMGLQPREKIAKDLQRCNCFVLSSQAETFGVVYIEALASGIPVIATKCGGPEGFVNQENGILISVDNLEELIESMQYMYQNIEQYNRESISQQVYKEFSPNVVSKQIIETYSKAVAKNEA